MNPSENTIEDRCKKGRGRNVLFKNTIMNWYKDTRNLIVDLRKRKKND